MGNASQNSVEEYQGTRTLTKLSLSTDQSTTLVAVPLKSSKAMRILVTDMQRSKTADLRSNKQAISRHYVAQSNLNIPTGNHTQSIAVCMVPEHGDHPCHQISRVYTPQTPMQEASTAVLPVLPKSRWHSIRILLALEHQHVAGCLHEYTRCPLAGDTSISTASALRRLSLTTVQHCQYLPSLLHFPFLYLSAGRSS